MYTKKNFGKELEMHLLNGFNALQLSKWAYEIYLNNCTNLENGLKEIIMDIVMMEEGPQFEYTKEELYTLARKLQTA